VTNLDIYAVSYGLVDYSIEVIGQIRIYDSQRGMRSMFLERSYPVMDIGGRFGGSNPSRPSILTIQ
jgi:hypothetical protein